VSAVAKALAQKIGDTLPIKEVFVLIDIAYKDGQCKGIQEYNDWIRKQCWNKQRK
jgi:hypothetical protein